MARLSISTVSLTAAILAVIISLIITGLKDVLLPYGTAVTMSKAEGNLATFSPVDYDNESMLEPGEYVRVHIIHFMRTPTPSSSNFASRAYILTS